MCYTATFIVNSQQFSFLEDKMYQRERLNEILEIVKKNGYVTVKYLVSVLHYSNATINRDLNYLEKQKLIRRSYGGVEYIQTRGHGPLPFRYHRNHIAKRKMGIAAAALVQDGDVVFIDATTTTEYIAEFLMEKKNITVISNNLSVVRTLSEAGISVICLGGKMVEAPSMLLGEETIENAMKYRADKAFMSTGYVSQEGNVGDGEYGGLLHRIMVQNAKESYLLADKEKFDEKYQTKRFAFDCSILTGVITDKTDVSDLQEKYPSTRFIQV